MKTFTINFTDFTGRCWTMNWIPSTSKNKKLSDDDIAAVVHFIKTLNWPKSTSPAAKNCYETLAAQIANKIIDAVSISENHADDFLERLVNAYDSKALSPKGVELFYECVLLGEECPTLEKLNLLSKVLRKLVKTEKLFAVKFAEDETWCVRYDYIKELLMKDTDTMRCCICGTPINNDRLGHNPYPVRPESWYGEKENRCCGLCNQRIVIPARIRYGRNVQKHHNRLMEMDYDELMNFVA